MKDSYDIAVFHGDGIGPEITRPTLEILSALAADGGYDVTFESCPAGAAHYAELVSAVPHPEITVEVLTQGGTAVPDYVQVLVARRR